MQELPPMTNGLDFSSIHSLAASDFMLLQDDVNHISLNPLNVDASALIGSFRFKVPQPGGFTARDFDGLCRAFAA